MFGGNSSLRGPEENVKITPEQLKELKKCALEPIYFIRNYVYINTKDGGMQLFKLYDFQEALIGTFNKYRFTITKFPRQCGKSATSRAYILWYALFHKDKVVAILGNKLTLAQEQLQQLRDSYNMLPYWMQPGVKQWNKRGIQFSHGTRILCAATSPDGIRGLSINLLFLDEFAFVKSHIASDFIASVFPTISSGKSTKMIICSTPSGMNHFFDMWDKGADTENQLLNGNTNGFMKSEIEWNAVPGRDAEWARKEIQTIGEIRFNQEYRCISFNSLINIHDTSTNTYTETTIGKLYNELGIAIDQPTLQKVRNNTIKILTPTGYKNFDGIAKYPAQVGITLHLSNQNTFNCASGHLIKSEDKFIPASETLNKSIGYDADVIVNAITLNNDSEHYYDILEVEGHEYISSGIVSHNCEFIGSVSTLIDHNLLKTIKHEEPIKIPNLPENIRIFEIPKQYAELEHKGWEYVASLDSGYGVYKDFTVLQIVLVKSNTNVHQVAVFSANNMDIEVFCKKAAVLLKKYHNPGLIIEQNGPGIAALKYFYSKLEYDNLIHFDPRGYKTGLWVTPKTKLQACVIFKTFIQRKFLKVKDKETIKEMFSFGRLTDMKWGGMGGNHDDHITSLYWIPFYINSPMFSGNTEEVNMDDDGTETDLSGLTQEDLTDETEVMMRLRKPEEFDKLMAESTEYGGTEHNHVDTSDEDSYVEESDIDDLEYEGVDTSHNGSIIFSGR